MNTLVNTVFKSKMKTANTRFEDKYQKIKKCGNARKARVFFHKELILGETA